MPKTTIGNYWICNNEGRKILNIEAKAGKWRALSGSEAQIVNMQKIVKSTKDAILKNGFARTMTLEEFGTYYVHVRNFEELFVLYIAPTYDNYIKLELKDSSDILIGNGNGNHIQYNNFLVKQNHARIYYENGQLKLSNYDKDYGAFINNKPVGPYQKLLFNGDVIFIMGLKIIIMGKYIYINNPENLVRLDSSKFSVNNEKVSLPPLEQEEDTSLDLYSDKDYFARAPIIGTVIEREKVRIDAPPPMQSKEGMPFIYILGSTLSMGAVTLISGFSSIDALASGRLTFKEAFPSILITCALLFGTILIPILNLKYDKKQKLKYEKTRQKRYIDYINSKISQINEIMAKQRNTLLRNYPSSEECNSIILSKNPRLWERKIEDSDFLAIKLGTRRCSFRCGNSVSRRTFYNGKR